MDRALAHIEEIAWVKPIEGADNIEAVGVLDWNLIANKLLHEIRTELRPYPHDEAQTAEDNGRVLKTSAENIC